MHSLSAKFHLLVYLDISIWKVENKQLRSHFHICVFLYCPLAFRTDSTTCHGHQSTQYFCNGVRLLYPKCSTLKLSKIADFTLCWGNVATSNAFKLGSCNGLQQRTHGTGKFNCTGIFCSHWKLCG